MDTDSPNGRLLARIDERLKSVQKQQQDDRAYNAQRFDSLEQKLEHQAREVAQVKSCQAKHTQRWTDHDTEHERLERRKNIADGVVGVVGAVAGLVTGLVSGGQP